MTEIDRAVAFLFKRVMKSEVFSSKVKLTEEAARDQKSMDVHLDFSMGGLEMEVHSTFLGGPIYLSVISALTGWKMADKVC